MAYNINILQSASADYFTISADLLEYSQKQSTVFVESFQKFLGTVSTMPLLYPKYNKKPKFRKAAIAYGYVAFYKVNKKTKTVEIHRIFSSKQNIENLL